MITRVAAACAVLGWLAQPQIARPQVLGVAHVRLLSSDLAKARRFYGALLGFSEVPQASPNAAIFRINDRQRIIVRRASDNPADRFENVAFEIDAVEPMRRQLAARGITARDVDDAGEGQGRALDTADPDGHHVWLIELSPGDAGAVETGDRRLSKRLLHIGLTIRDQVAADRYYKDALGFSEIWRGGRAEGAVNWINMRVPDGTDYLEYMLTPSPLDRRQLGTAHHLALAVPDIQAVLEAVRARTDAGDPNHRAVPQIGVNRRWQLNVYDPDGTRVEFMEPWTVR